MRNVLENLLICWCSGTKYVYVRKHAYKTKKATEIMFSECNENQEERVKREICHFTIKIKISGCASVER